MFKKIAAEALGLSDIGVIVPPSDYTKVDADEETGTRFELLFRGHAAILRAWASCVGTIPPTWRGRPARVLL